MATLGRVWRNSVAYLNRRGQSGSEITYRG